MNTVSSFSVTHSHTQPFYCSSGICPGPFSVKQIIIQKQSNGLKCYILR